MSAQQVEPTEKQSAGPPQPAQTQPSQPAAKPPATRGRRRAFTIFAILLLIVGVGGLLYWLHARDFESTDDAEVEAHLIPVTSRIDGSITHVYVDNNQAVQAGQALIDLDPRDFQVSLDQAKAQLAQARSQVVAQQPNVPITQVENTTNILSAEADVANAQAAFIAAQRDRESSAAHLAEAQANEAKTQADLARYKLLIAKEEVSEQEYDQIVAAAKAQQATVAGAQAAHCNHRRRLWISAAHNWLKSRVDWGNTGAMLRRRWQYGAPRCSRMKPALNLPRHRWNKRN